MRCDIIIPVWNQLDATRECIDSIVDNTGYPYKLILIDNASEKETADYLRSLKERLGGIAVIIRNDRNLGFAKAVNQGMKSSDAEYVCLMNNDTIAFAGWLTEMINIMKRSPDIGIMNPSSNTSGQFPGELSIDEYAAGLKVFSGQTQELSVCRGFCMVIKKDVIKKIGYLDEIYDIGYFEETDYCRRAAKASYRMARAKGAYVYHKEGVSFKGRADSDAIFKKNEKIFTERWGRPLKIGYFMGRPESAEDVNKVALKTVKFGHQAVIFIKNSLAWPVEIDHFDIRKEDAGPVFFRTVSFLKILKRRKKKKLDILITDSPLFSSVLKATRFFHKAEVFTSPFKGDIGRVP